MAALVELLGAELIQHIKAYIDERLGVDESGGGDSVAMQTYGVETYLDPFIINLSPLSLPLPEAFARIVAVLATHPADDHVIVRVSSHSWEDFYRRLLAAAKQFPDFLDTAVNLQQRFGFVSSPSAELPEISIIPAGAGYAPLGDWVGRYDQVYSAVLVMRYAAGTVPEEYV